MLKKIPAILQNFGWMDQPLQLIPQNFSWIRKFISGTTVMTNNITIITDSKLLEVKLTLLALVTYPVRFVREDDSRQPGLSREVP